MSMSFQKIIILRQKKNKQEMEFEEVIFITSSKATKSHLVDTGTKA